MYTPPQQPWASSPAPAQPAYMPPPRPLRETVGGKILIGLGTIVALGAIYLLYLAVRNLSTPKIVYPVRNYPSPNAFATYELAGKRIVHKEDIAALFDRKAPRKFSDAEREKIVAANAAPLADFRRGFNRGYLAPPVRSFSQKLPYLADFRTGARLMALESQTKRARGDRKGAAAASLDAIEFGRQVSHGSTILGGLVSIACQAIGRRGLWQAADEFSASEAKAATQRLESLMTKGATYAEILDAERWTALGGTVELFRHPKGFSEWDETDATDESQKAEDAAASEMLLRTMFFFYGKQNILNHINQAFDAAIAQAKKPYADDHAPLPKPRDTFTAILLPVIGETRIKFVYSDAQNALLLTALALRAYKAEHGAYPASLDALAPAYLNRLPDDPFAQNAPLRYRLIGEKYLLYSVGPDGSDDVGRPLENPNAPEADRRKLSPDSKGDIVSER